MTYPSPSTLHIVPTARDPSTGLALSSRNVYLSPTDLSHAPILFLALQKAKNLWDGGANKAACVKVAVELINEKARALQEADKKGVPMQLDYVEINDPDTLEALDDDATCGTEHEGHREALLSGAIWVRKTRLIDNIILGDVDRILG